MRGLYGRALLSVLACHFEVYRIVLPFGFCVDYGVGAPSERLWEVPIQKAIIVNVWVVSSCDMCKQGNQKHSIEKHELHPFQCTLYTSTLEYNSNSRLALAQTLFQRNTIANLSTEVLFSDSGLPLILTSVLRSKHLAIVFL